MTKKNKAKTTNSGSAHRDAESQPASGRSFEQALQRLEQIVERLEGGEETLEQSARLYEEAIALSRFCEEQLRQVQQRIEKLDSASAAEQTEAESAA